MKNERTSSFELLRLLCIFGILVMHTFAATDSTASLANTAVNVAVNTVFNTGVTCFILISGYFGIRFDLSKLIRLDLMIIFFTVCGTVAVGDFGLKSLIKACIPVISRRYWFISCYFALCVLVPFLNRIPEKLSKERFRQLLFVLLFLFCLIPTLTTYDIMQDAGKGLMHFVMIYLTGRYLCLWHPGRHYPARLLSGIALSLLFVFCADLLLTLRSGVLYSTFSRDCSLFTIAAAVLIVLLFKELHFSSRLINRAAKSVLAIYVLDPFISTILRRYADPSAHSAEWYLIFLIFGFVLLIMIIAGILDEARRFTVGRMEPPVCRFLTGAATRACRLFVRLADRLSAVILKVK